MATMSETAPEHEEPEHSWVCPSCSVRQPLGEAIWVRYNKQPWFNFVKMDCASEECGDINYLFTLGMEEDLEDVPFHQVYTVDFAPDTIVQGYKQVNGIEDIEVRQLDYGQEQLVKRWAKALEGVYPFDITHDETGPDPKTINYL